MATPSPYQGEGVFINLTPGGPLSFKGEGGGIIPLGMPIKRPDFDSGV